MIKNNLLFSILIVTLALPHARAGSFAGNGADRRNPGEGAAWFLGARPIRWCTTDGRVAPAFMKATHLWQDYLSRKRVTERLQSPLPLSTTFEHVASCDGTEDLKIETGDAPESGLLSQSELLQYDLNQGWGKGRILIDKKIVSASGTQLEVQLLHQLGHVLGCDHIDGTIMDENVPTGRGIMKPSIDQVRELVLCRDCATKIQGKGSETYSEQVGQVELNLPTGPIRIRLLTDLSSVSVSDAPVFLIDYRNYKGSLFSEALSRLGRVESPESGAQVIINRNFDSRASVQLIQNGVTSSVFEADQ